MDYYSCPIEELHKEIRRRGYKPCGTSDQLSEGLRRDDDARGADATTVKTEDLSHFVPQELSLLRTAEFGETTPAGLLTNEKIVYWTMNTFFPTLQLFFESGLSSTIDGGRLPDARVGLDPRLRFRLTDCTREENGCMVKTTVPEKFANSGSGLVIREAVIARRTSIAVKPTDQQDTARSLSLSPSPPSARIVHEIHIVVGLRLEGMKKIAYIWSKVRAPSGSEGKTWGDVRIAGLRDDIPAPSSCFPEHTLKPGGQITVVLKESLIRENSLEEDIEAFLG